MSKLAQVFPRLELVVAVADNGVIGADLGLPWRQRADLRHFKQLTMGHPIVMGRRTWASIGRALPGRLNIVLTRDLSFEPAGAVACDAWADAVSIAREQAEEDGASEICVIGGAEIYRLALPRARFDAPDPAQWRETGVEAFAAGEGDDAPFVIRQLERI